jgi:dsDNA-binding SOS-regulon protein
MTKNDSVFLKELSFFPIKNIGFAIGEIDETQELNPQNIDINIKSTEWSLKKANKHAKIIQEIHENNDIVPVRFLTIFETQENLQKHFKNEADKYKKMLQFIKDKTEYTLRIWVEKQAIYNDILQENIELKKIMQEIKELSEGQKFVAKKQVEKKINLLYPDFVNQKMQSFLKNLQKNTIDIKIIPFKEEKEKNATLIAKIAILIQKNKKFTIEENELTDAFSIEISEKLPIFNFLENNGK